MGFGIFGGTAAVLAAPYIEYLYPAGVQQGRTIEITLGGKALDGARDVWVSGEGVTGKVLEVNLPTDKQIEEAKKRDEVAAQTARLRLTIAPDAPEGVRDLRIMAREGLSNRFRFTIGDIPEIAETEPNSLIEDAEKIPPLPVVVNGQIKNADRDFFRFTAKAGQKLVIEVAARSIKPFLADAVPGWFQAKIQLYDAAHNLIAEADDFRFDPDPLMFFTVPADGDYIVEIWDALSRGRDDLVYRMRIGEFPYVTDIFPLGGTVGTELHRITARGVNLPGDTANWKCNLANRQPGVVPVGFKLKTGETNRRPFELSDLPEVTEREPNNNQRQAQRVTTPVIINGRINKPGDIDMFTFSAKKGDKLVFDVMARRLDSPLDAKIRIGPQPLLGKLLESDDVKDERYGLVTHHADPRLAHTFEKDGDYFIAIEDIQGKGGPEYGYRLSIAPQQPDFDLRVTPDNLSVPVGGNVVVQLKAIRLDGYNGPIRLHTEGLPDGFNLAGAEIPAGKNQAILTLAAPQSASAGVYKPRFWAEAEIDGKIVKHDVSAAEELMQAFFYYHTVPVDQGYLVVTPPNAFRVEITRPANAGPLELVLGKETEIPVRIIRNAQAMAALQAQSAKANAPKGGGVKNKEGTQPKKTAPKNEKNPPKVGRVNQGKAGGQQAQAVSKLPIRVTATRGGKGMIAIAAVIEADANEGVITVRCTNAAMVGQEGVFIVEGTLRTRGSKITSIAAALPFKVLPAEGDEKVVLARDKADKKKTPKNAKK